MTAGHQIRVTGVGQRSVKPDKIEIDIQFRIHRPTPQETMDIDSTVERDFGRVIQEVEISPAYVRLVNYSLQSACENGTGKEDEGDYDCFESHRHYRIRMPIDLDLVVRLLHTLPSFVTPTSLEIRYVVENSGYEIDCLEANAVRRARHRAEVLAEALIHHLSFHALVDCTNIPVEVSHLVYRMRRSEDLSMVSPQLLSIPDDGFPISCTVEVLFNTYSRTGAQF